MFNAESIVDVLRTSIIETEVATTRALAEQIRKLPAGFPPSEIADMLDAIASETKVVHDEGAAKRQYLHNWRHVECVDGRSTLNPRDADRCSGCGVKREELARHDEVQAVPFQ